MNITRWNDAGSERLGTGFDAVDGILSGGFGRGELAVIGSRPGMGRTAFICEIALKNAAFGRRVLVIPDHQEDTELARRLLTMATGAEPYRMRDRSLPCPDDDVCIEEQRRRLAELGIELCTSAAGIDSSAWELQQMVGRSGGADLVIFERCLHGKDPLKPSPTENGIRIAVRTIKTLARDIGAAVICASDVSISCETRRDKRPLLRDIPLEGVSTAADTVLFLYREGCYDDSVPDDVCRVIVAKNRHGRIGSTDLQWDGCAVRFCNKGTAFTQG